MSSVDSELDEKARSRPALGEYKALITAGGIGTRLLPFSKEIPKEMFPILVTNGSGSLQLKPVVQAIFEQLHTGGVRNFYFVVGRGKRAIEDHFCPDPGFLRYLDSKGKLPKSLSDFYENIRSSNLAFLNQLEPSGFGDAVQQGRPLIHEDFMVLAGDTYILSTENRHLSRLVAAHRKYRASATILLQDVPDPRNYGVVEGNSLEEGVLRITHAVEKPESPRSNCAIMPVYFFTESIFDALSETEPGNNGELQLTDAIETLITSGKPVLGVKLKNGEVRLDLGSPETIIEALKVSLMQANGGAATESASAVPESTDLVPPVGLDSDSQKRPELTQLVPVRKKKIQPID